MAKPSGLGKGLGALLGDDFNTTNTTTSSLPISQIESHAGQPRKYFDDEALDELAVTAGLADAEELIANTELLRKELQIPADFKPYGLNKTHYPFIIQNCRSGSMKCNPRNMSDAQVAELLEKLT